MTGLVRKVLPGLMAAVMFLTAVVCPCALGLASMATRSTHSCCERGTDGGKGPIQNHGDRTCNECNASRALDVAKTANVDVSPFHLVAFVHAPVWVMAPASMPVRCGDVPTVHSCPESGNSLLRLHCALLV